MLHRYLPSLSLVVFLSVSFCATAQRAPKPDRDSLLSIWSDSNQPDTVRAQALYLVNYNYFLFSQPDSSRKYTAMLYDFAREKNLEKYEAMCENAYGTADFFSGNFSSAIEHYETALPVFERIGYREGMATSLGNMGTIYLNQGDYLKAIDLLKRTVVLQQELGNEKSVSSCYNNISLAYSYMADYIPALAYAKKSLAIKMRLGDTKGTGNVLNSIGLIYQHTSDFDIAADYLLQSYELAVKADDKAGIAMALNNLGVNYNKMGDYARAFDYFSQSLRLYEEMKNRKNAGSCLANLGLIYYYQGDYPNAVNCFERGLHLSDEAGDPYSAAIALNNLGNTYKKDGDLEKALSCHYRSLAIRETIHDKKGIASSINNIGHILMMQEKYDEALVLLHQSAVMKQQIEDHHALSSTFQSIAQVHRNIGDLDSSLFYSNLALAVAEKVYARAFVRDAVLQLYETHLLLDHRDSAYRYLLRLTASLNEELQTNYFTLPEREKELYYKTFEGHFMHQYDFAAAFGQDYPGLADSAYNTALRMKGLSLRSSTAMRTAIHNSNDSLLIEHYENWRVLKQNIAKKYASGEDIAPFVRQADSLEKELVRRSTVFSSFEKANRVNWMTVRDGLHPGEAAIEFVHYRVQTDGSGKIRYLAMVVRHNSTHPELVPLCSEDELAGVLGDFQGNNLQFVNRTYGTRSDARTSLYELIWKPLESTLKGAKTVYFSPDGLLHKISFAALAVKEDMFLCDRYDLLRYGTTAGILAPDAGPASDRPFLVMGGIRYTASDSAREIWSYLPGSLEETTAITEMLGRKQKPVRFFTSSEATERVFKEELPNAGVLHIATHGFFFPDPEAVKKNMVSAEESSTDLIFRGTTNYADWSFVQNENPLMRSGLVLAGANEVWSRDPLTPGEDGILTAQEVSHLDLLGTRLVVLSACETGLGDIEGSEGVYGLQRAFKIAGARYLIMSLWQVPDHETAVFMKLFYSRLLRHDDVPRAFREAQQQMRREYDPYYWAAFILLQ